jgi:hypothetical protein
MLVPSEINNKQQTFEENPMGGLIAPEDATVMYQKGLVIFF